MHNLASTCSYITGGAVSKKGGALNKKGGALNNAPRKGGWRPDGRFSRSGNPSALAPTLIGTRMSVGYTAAAATAFAKEILKYMHAAGG